MGKLDLDAASACTGSLYPAPLDAACVVRTRHHVDEPGDLRDFGVSLLQRPPDVWPDQRHWYNDENKCVWVLDGEVTLIADADEALLHADDCASLLKGMADGHHITPDTATPKNTGLARRQPIP